MPSRRIRSTARQALIAQKTAALDEVTKTGRESAALLKRQHEKVVDDWEHKPKFIVRELITPALMEWHIDVTGDHRDIWKFVDRGTQGPYPIPKVARKPEEKPLRFQTGYSPRTLPIAKYNQGTGAASGKWASKRQVTHPGIKAREFSKTIGNRHLPQFRRDMENAFRRGVRRARG